MTARTILRRITALLATVVMLAALAPDAAKAADPAAPPGAGTLPPGAGTLARVRASGMLRCGVIPSGQGLSTLDEQGWWNGFFPDLCRALAAAVTGSGRNVDFVELNTRSRLAVAAAGGVDVLMASTTWTLKRESEPGLVFPYVALYDGLGLMAHKSAGITTLDMVQDASVCVADGTTTVRNLEDWAKIRGVRLTVRRSPTVDAAATAFFNHHCDLLAADRTALYARRALHAPVPSDYMILPGLLAKEPLSAAIAAGDPVWERVVRWVFFAAVLAEERNITSDDAAFPKPGTNYETARLLGLTPGFGAAMGADLGLDDQWLRRAIAEAGNYREIFERNLGRNSLLKLERGLNALWTDGGLLFAPPLGG